MLNFDLEKSNTAIQSILQTLTKVHLFHSNRYEEFDEVLIKDFTRTFNIERSFVLTKKIRQII